MYIVTWYNKDAQEICFSTLLEDLTPMLFILDKLDIYYKVANNKGMMMPSMGYKCWLKPDDEFKLSDNPVP